MPVNSLNNGQIKLADLNDKISFNIEFKIRYNQQGNYTKLYTLVWHELFGLIAPKFLATQIDENMSPHCIKEFFTSP
jgi:hypothetical protein